MDTSWLFVDPPNVAVITVAQITDSDHPVLYVSHDADDGAWQFLTGGPLTETDARVVSLRSMLQRDPSLVELADLPRGWIAWRDDRTCTWQRAAR
jgi:hypothetical protein